MRREECAEIDMDRNDSDTLLVDLDVHSSWSRDA